MSYESFYECLTFESSRPISLGSSRLEDDQSVVFDFITFLTVVQKLRIAILPIQWQPMSGSLGSGGQGRIDQASMTIQTSLAFKRFATAQHQNVADDKIFRQLICEIIVLGHPVIKAHRNILQLQGICWDIDSARHSNHNKGASTNSSDYSVWPALVFEKSPFGNLYQFATSALGRELDVKGRLNLCIDICRAIRDMHCYGTYLYDKLLSTASELTVGVGIIHGDIKPQNVLVFRKGDGSFIAKVMDFGYSACVLKDDGVFLPRSRPWHAPEHSFMAATMSQARSMDIFSVGVLCLWFMYEQYFSKPESLPSEVQRSIPSLSSWSGQAFSEWELIEVLKEEGNLALLAKTLLSADETLSIHDRLAAHDFFQDSLSTNPELRLDDLEACFPRSRPIRSEVTSNLYGGHDDQVHLLSGSDFKLSLSLKPLCSSDYRVRSYIISCLEDRLRRQACMPLRIQLALCHKIGFGRTRNDARANELLESTQTSIEDFENLMTDLQNPVTIGRAGTKYRDLLSMDHITTLNHYDVYSECGILNQAMTALQQEIEDFSRTLGYPCVLVTQLQEELAGLLIGQADWIEAEKLVLQLKEARTQLFGEYHQYTIQWMGLIVEIYLNQGRWKEAEGLQIRFMETIARTPDAATYPMQKIIGLSKLAAIYDAQGLLQKTAGIEVEVAKNMEEILGEDHPDTLIAKNNLASTYREQGLWERAEILTRHVLDRKTKTLRTDHRSIISSMNTLAGILYAQARWDDAVSIQEQSLETQRKTLRADHPLLLVSQGRIASILHDRGDWKAAETLYAQLVDDAERVLGKEHPTALELLEKLAMNYNTQGRSQEANDILSRVLGVKCRTMGQEHQSTLNSIANLATIHLEHCCYTKAENMQLQHFEASKRNLGLEHPNTLQSWSNLSGIYHCMGKWKEAEEILEQMLKIATKTFTPGHPVICNGIGKLAGIFYEQARYDEAENLQTYLLNLTQETLGEEHPETLHTMTNLAIMYSARDRFREGERLQLRVLESHKKRLGPEHPATLSAIGDLAATYLDLGRNEEAECLQVEVIEAQKRMLGPEHRDTLIAMNGLAATYDAQGRSAEALGLQEQVLASSRKVMGHSHPRTLSFSERLARMLEKLDRRDEATDLMKSCLEQRRLKLGPNHPKTMETEDTLRMWQSRGDHEGDP